MKVWSQCNAKERFCVIRRTPRHWKNFSAFFMPNAAHAIKPLSRKTLFAASKSIEEYGHDGCNQRCSPGKYGEAARRVVAGQSNSCFGAAACGTDIDPITR